MSNTRLDSHQGFLLDEIISTNQSRLLGRLRSKHVQRPSYGLYKPPILLQLAEAFRYLKRKKKRDENIELLQSVVVKLEESFNSLEKLSTDNARANPGAVILRKIIFVISSELDMTKLRKILGSIPSKDSPWPGSHPERVVRKYQKLAQYVVAASQLRRLIGDYQTWEIEGVRTVPFARYLSKANTKTSAGYFTRSMTTGTAKEQHICQIALETKLSKGLADIETGIQDILEERKSVHAEIQLLYHYVQHPEVTLPPRVLASNKESCYLCNLFIKLHGEFYSPKSHGKFYSKWALPNDDQLKLSKGPRARINQILSKFNDSIEEKIEFCLQNPLQRRLAPSESTILSESLYTSSVTSLDRSGMKREKTKPDPSASDNSGNQLRSRTGEAKVLSLVEPLGDHSLGSNKSTFVTDIRKIGPPEDVPECSISSLRPSQDQNHASESDRTELNLAGPNTTCLTAAEQESREVSLEKSEADATSESHSSQDTLQPHSLPRRVHKSVSLSFGSVTNIQVSRGSYVRFQTRKLHFEFAFEQGKSTSEAILNPDKKIMLHVRWLANEPNFVGIEAVDLEAPRLEGQEAICDDIFSRRGMIFHGKGHTILIQARMSTEMQYEMSANDFTINLPNQAQ
jgi:OTT_1508-like deaminase